jgi:acetyl-CoA C-acetyltransferase
MMRDTVICEPLRTPIGRYGGALASMTATQLAVKVLESLIKRTGLAPSDVDEVVLGHCYPNSDAPAIGRVVALDAGLPVSVPGLQVDRRCGSGLQAIIYAAMQVRSGDSDLVVAGGTESMSNVAFYSTQMRGVVRGDAVLLHDGLARGRVTAGGERHPVPGGMLETAENLRRDYKITRAEQDALAFRSHERAVAAQRSGDFAEEIVPIAVSARSGETIVEIDEHPRADASIDKLSSLVPVRIADDPEATVTAGNASGQNDAASLCIVTTPEKAANIGLKPVARLIASATAGVAPDRMGIGPVPAVDKVLQKAGLTLEQMGLIELNEAFAAQVLACTREWAFQDNDFDRLNVQGSGIALGHPVGATGARILCTLTREMQRRGCQYGLETMCIGGGQGLAAILELVS